MSDEDREVAQLVLDKAVEYQIDWQKAQANRMAEAFWGSGKAEKE